LESIQQFLFFHVWQGNAYSHPKNWGFGGFDPKWEQYQCNPQKAHPVRLTKKPKKRKTSIRTVANWVFTQTTHVIGSI